MENPDSIIDNLKTGDRPVIGCFPLYPPLELLHSFGLNPFILWNFGNSFRKTPASDRHVRTYVCSAGRRGVHPGGKSGDPRVLDRPLLVR